MDDPILISRLLAGEESAFDAFVDDFYPRLYRFAFRRVGSDPEATQDVVQSTFEKAIPKLDRYRGEAALFTWLCSFCRFEIAAFWRARNRIAPEMIDDTPEIRAALESLARIDDTPEGQLEKKELAQLVRLTLDALPIRYGNALEWKYLHGWSVQQIAERLGLSPKATESLLTRAREAFRDGFGELAGEWSRT